MTTDSGPRADDTNRPPSPYPTSYGQAPYAPAGPFPPAPNTPEPPKRNILGIVALVLSILGLVLACIPGVIIAGWILLPISFILGLVSLFLPAKKGMGIAAIIVAVVGTIVAVVVFVAVIGNAAADAFQDADSSITGGSQVAASETPEPDAAQEAPGGDAAGSRENPGAIGSVVSSDDWDVTVTNFVADAGSIVADANPFNTEAPSGSHYATVTYSVTYKGDESSYAAEVGVALVTASGEVLDGTDALVVLEDPIGLDELYAGGTASGSVAFLVPNGAEVLIRVTPGFFGEEQFIRP